MENYLNTLKKFKDFDGRASRRQYWMFVLYSLIISFSLFLLDELIFSISPTLANIGFINRNGFISLIYETLLIIPSFAIGVRRLHDIDRSGYWIFFPIVNLIMLIIKGDEGRNSYGEPSVYKK